MSSGKGFTDDGLPDHLLRWLEMTTRRVAAELRAGWTADQEPAPRPSQRRALQMILDDGVRVSELAAIAGTTKQAAGELVDGLEKDGLVVSERDPRDARVRLVRRTELGDRAADAGHARIAMVEARLREEVGARRYDEMVQVLRELSRGMPEH